MMLLRSIALALAYLLALQVSLLAWTVVPPTVAGLPALAQASLCVAHADASLQPGDRSPAGCPCGPLCSMAGCGSCGDRAVVAAQVVLYPAAQSRSFLPQTRPAPLRRSPSEPGQARAPPALA